MRIWLILFLGMAGCTTNGNQENAVNQYQGQRKTDPLRRIDSIVAASKLHINPEDTCEINEPNMKGYIMATRRWTNTNYKFFCPSRAEVFIAEDLFRKYIDTFCRKTRANDTIVKDQEIASFKTCDCIALKFEIKKYFRQYTGWTENGIRYIYFECLAPELQKNEDLKKQWSFICDGGTILFHITVNLNTGNVEVSDNGVG